MQTEIIVEQVDRDVALATLRLIRGYAVRVRDEHPLVQAFARHRLAEREASARIAHERAAGRQRLYEENGASINAAKAVEAEEIATAIRNRTHD